jgi:hypothetical protein
MLHRLLRIGQSALQRLRSARGSPRRMLLLQLRLRLLRLLLQLQLLWRLLLLC